MEEKVTHVMARHQSQLPDDFNISRYFIERVSQHANADGSVSDTVLVDGIIDAMGSTESRIQEIERRLGMQPPLDSEGHDTAKTLARLEDLTNELRVAAGVAHASNGGVVHADPVIAKIAEALELISDEIRNLRT